MSMTKTKPDALEGWEYDLESPSADEIRSQFGGDEIGPEKLRVDQWRYLVHTIEKLGRIASSLVDPCSDRARYDGTTVALVEAVSSAWEPPPDFNASLALRSAMSGLAIAAGIQLQLDVRADRERGKVQSPESNVAS